MTFFLSLLLCNNNFSSSYLLTSSNPTDPERTPRPPYPVRSPFCLLFLSCYLSVHYILLCYFFPFPVRPITSGFLGCHEPKVLTRSTRPRAATPLTNIISMCLVSCSSSLAQQLAFLGNNGSTAIYSISCSRLACSSSTLPNPHLRLLCVKGCERVGEVPSGVRRLASLASFCPPSLLLYR